VNPASEAATWALVLDHFKGLTPADLAAMTPYQLHELYLHARDDEGRVVLPRPARRREQKPRGEEQHVRDYLRVAKHQKFPAEVIEAQVARIRELHKRRRDAQPGDGAGAD
jgi:hypothetical protein